MDFCCTYFTSKLFIPEKRRLCMSVDTQKWPGKYQYKLLGFDSVPEEQNNILTFAAVTTT